MKKGSIGLLLSFAGVVLIGFFLLADLLSPKPPVGDPSKDGSPKESISANDALVNLSSAPEIQEGT